ncbi:MAG: hypothetical protein ACRD5K_07255 [Candidatus Acidiferrales bacterium]
MHFSDWLLLATLVLAWYHVGIVWLVQTVSWPIFAHVGQNEFEDYHLAWWHGIRYVILAPSALNLVGAIVLLRFVPEGVPVWLLWLALALYLLMTILTAAWWGPQQAKLTDPRSPRFTRILKTHWIRTALVSAFGLALLAALVLRMQA